MTMDFTLDFIDGLAAYLEQEYFHAGRDLSRVAVVFGGKRPAQFLKRRLARSAGKGFASPAFFTIDEFMDRVANRSVRLTPGSELDRSFTLYRLVKEAAPELLKGRGSFARFLPWAREILDFIEQLDLEMVDNQALTSIEANAAIGYAVPESINSLLGSIKVLRESFHAALEQGKKTCRGLQYLRAAREVGRHDWPEHDEIIFCNLFYFHRSEECVVRHFHERHNATLVFQGDERKWPVLKRIAERFGCEIKEGPAPTPTSFNLHIHAGFDVHSEAALVREILGRVPDLDRTVVVMPEPSNMVPLLSQLPMDLGGVNVSMGYRLKRSSLYFLLDFMMKAQLSRRNNRYYARDYLKVLNHPLILNLGLLSGGKAVRVLAGKVEEAMTGRWTAGFSGSSFVSLEEIARDASLFDRAAGALSGMGIGSDTAQLRETLLLVHAVFFSAWEGVEDLQGFAAALGRVLDLLVKESSLRDYPLNVNILSRLYDIKREFETALFNHEPFSFDEIWRIFEDKLSRELVNFSGTPLKGLQVLGLFETRSLQFDHVIVMDANEGVLPRLDIRSSLIPREVMMSLKLDRLELEEEIQRYQFMRIISSAREVHLVYQDRKDKERSRFIEELIWESEKKQNALLDYPVRRAAFDVQVTPRVRAVPKTPLLLEFLGGFRFSASSVNTYLKNPYEFYTNYCLGLKEVEDVLDEPDERLVGNFLHELLKDGLAPMLGRPFAMGEDVEARLWNIFQQKFDAEFGRAMRSDAFLVKAVITHRLKVFLEKERDQTAQVQEILHLETPFEAVLPLPRAPARFHCVVDRVDRLKDGTVLLIDYKTGQSDKLPRKDFSADNGLSRERIFKEVRSFQMPLYYYFLSREFPASPIRAELYNLRDSRRESFPRTAVTAHGDFLSPYLKALDFIMSEIMDPEKPFEDHDLKNYE
jgi:hypothetical protein